jgi:long-chain acyl-CoA synthetase
MNIYAVIREETAAHLEHAAVIDGDRRVSYGELFLLVDALARELQSFGVAPHQRIALSCTDSIEHIAVSLAALSLGAAIVPVSSSHSRDEVNAVLEELDVSLLISDRELFPPDHGGPTPSMKASRKTLLLHRRAAQETLPEEYYAMNPAFIRFSSGTTGVSKGVLLSHETIVERTDAADTALNVTRNDRVIWVLPMSYHFVVSILLFLRRAATIVLCGNEFPSSLIDGLVRRRGTFIYASPFHYRMITNSTMFPEDTFSNIRLAVSTSMRLPETDARRFVEKFGVELTEAYGIIEVGLPFVNRSSDPAKRGSVGSILPDYEARIESPNAEGIGDVYLRGRGMFDAYVSPWRGRDQALMDGWFKTGDLGRIDSDGFLFLVGRVSNVINFAGMKIFPDEVESVLNQHPAVKESLVYATAHAEYGELPCADIVLSGETDAADLDTTGIRRFCYQHLASYKVPKDFRQVLRLDKTASGKLKRWKRAPES